MANFKSCALGFADVKYYSVGIHFVISIISWFNRQLFEIQTLFLAVAQVVSCIFILRVFITTFWHIILSVVTTLLTTVTIQNNVIDVSCMH